MMSSGMTPVPTGRAEPTVTPMAMTGLRRGGAKLGAPTMDGAIPTASLPTARAPQLCRGILVGRSPLLATDLGLGPGHGAMPSEGAMLHGMMDGKSK